MPPITKEDLPWTRALKIIYKKPLMNKHAQILGRMGGKVKSKKKAIAARLNGKKGGYRKHKKVIHRGAID